VIEADPTMPRTFPIPHLLRCLLPMPSKLLSSAAAAALFVFAPALAAQGDVVVKKDGARLRGLEVTEFALTGVKAKRGDAAVEVPAHQVLEIQWADLPDSFVAARAAIERGDYGNAVQLYGEAANTATRDLLKLDAQFYQLKAAVAGVGTDKSAAQNAADRAKAWVDANGAHWHIPEALLLAGRAQRLAGATDAAVATLTSLDTRTTNEGFAPVWGARAKFELAQALLDGGKSVDARRAFQSASSAADNALLQPSADDAELRSIKLLARVGEGETYIGENDYAKAESFFASMKRADDRTLVAAGHAGEGEAILLSALASKNAGDLRRAQIALATAAVLDATGDVAAKANFYLGRCLLELGAEREGDTFKARAQAYFQTVVTHYPATRWAGLARAELAR
jgi:TolA-binding protein